VAVDEPKSAASHAPGASPGHGDLAVANELISPGRRPRDSGAQSASRVAGTSAPCSIVADFPAIAEVDGADAAADRPVPSVSRRAARASAGLRAALVLAALAGAALTLLARDDLTPNDLAFNLANLAAGAAYATLGALIVRRAGNVIGWLMLAESGGLVFISVASAYGVLGIATFPGDFPAARQAGALGESSWAASAFVIGFMFLLFPTGALLSRRWRPVAAAAALLAGLVTAGLILSPRVVGLPSPGGTSVTFRNPLGTARLPRLLHIMAVGTLNGLAIPFTAFLVVVFAALVLRYRSGGQSLRQQVKWLALAVAGMLAGLMAALLFLKADQPSLAHIGYDLVSVSQLFGIPVAMTIAILRHRLFDIDAIISRAVALGLLSAAFTGVYVAIVVGLGAVVGRRGGPVLTIAAAICIAVLFHPLWQRFRRFANRLVYGERATPYQVLSDFAKDMAGQLDFTEAVDRMVAVLAGATGADRAAAWIRVGGLLRPVAVWPRGSVPPPPVPIGPDGGLPPFGQASRAVPVRYANELLGALTLRKPPNEPLASVEDTLLGHLASQASLVLRNAQLTADLRATIDDLRASRRRLVEAQDAERRKIERNLHDGAQQQLVALSIQLGLLADQAEDPETIRQAIPALRDGLRGALDDLRDLARGIYPPLLAEQGLLAALQAQARKAPLPVLVEADGHGRYSPDTEATVYFCILEALQNTAKYAKASAATIRLAGHGSGLRFTVTDDGVGFDAASTAPGSGLQGMTDRLAALGGTLRIQSAPGNGTTLTGELPASPRGDRPLTTRPSAQEQEVP
jgi:signal transduction histidine kinase